MFLGFFYDVEFKFWLLEFGDLMWFVVINLFEFFGEYVFVEVGGYFYLIGGCIFEGILVCVWKFDLKERMWIWCMDMLMV